MTEGPTAARREEAGINVTRELAAMAGLNTGRESGTINPGW